MSVWPASLPFPAVNSLKESPPDNTMRSQMDKGPEKMRRRTTANVRPLSFTLNLTPALVNTLDAFYISVEGEVFDYTHPRTLAAVKARFTAPPDYMEKEATIYDASISLEIMP